MELTGNIPSVAISGFLPLPNGNIQYPEEFTESQLALILKDEKDLVTVGICNPEDKELLEVLSHFHKKRIRLFRIDHDELFQYLSKAKSAASSITPGNNLYNRGKLFLDRIANDAPVINLVNSILIEAIRKRASDIHIEAFQERLNVRYRIDGILSLHSRMEPALFPAVASRIKIMANLNITEHRIPQDGRIAVHLGKNVRDIRVSIVPTVWGGSIALRLLNRTSSLGSLESLGLSKKALADLKKIAGFPSGLILLSGPTGSGKTTTMNALIREMDTEGRKIVTMEDPVEYAVEGVNQIQINNAAGLTYSSILKRVLRQDPDVLVIGEIRDRETARLAVRTALTGHIVLSTLHTDDCVSVIDRLTDMGIERYMTAAVLKASIAQRLAGRLCSVCRAEKTEKVRHSGFYPEHCFEPRGCSACGGTGYSGRVLLIEYFILDKTTARMTASGDDSRSIRDYLRAKGTGFLMDDAVRKAEAGIISAEEAYRTAAVR